MKLLNTLLITSAALLGHVAANPQSLGFEVVQFYYVYKMEYLSKIPEKERRLGVGCSTKHGRLCYFDEFAESILPEGHLKDWFHRNKFGTEDARTLTPDDRAARAISQTALGDDSIVATELSKTVVNDEGRVRYTDVLTDITDVADKAMAAGGVAKADADGAVNYAWKARKVRSDDAYIFVRGVITNVLGTKATSLYFVEDRSAKTINFGSTFQKISAAAAAGQINANQAATYKKVVRDAARGILTGTSQANINHWAIVKSFQTFCSKTSEQAKALASGSAAPRAPRNSRLPGLGRNVARRSRSRRSTRFGGPRG